MIQRILYQVDKEFKVMIIKMLAELRRRMDEHSENFDKETENVRKYQTESIELKNTISELKDILENWRGSTTDGSELRDGSASWKTKQWKTYRATKRKKNEKKCGYLKGPLGQDQAE